MKHAHHREPPASPAGARPTTDPAASAVLQAFRHLFHAYHPRDFALRLWDGTEWPAETEEPSFIWVIRRRGALRRMFRAWDTDAYLGEAYVHGDFDIEGRLEAAFPVGDWLLRGGVRRRDTLRLALDLRRLPDDDDDLPDHAAHLRGKVHSRDRDRQAISFHYDRSNDFYALWLDRRMVYSCAYFETADTDLDAAQQAKLDLVCRKLRLRPGQRLLDIGCGWGSLVMHAARRFGVDATGITLSERQAEFAARRIEEAGLADRCRVRIRDYRDLPDDARFDRIASIGMVEHVGAAKLPEYFATAWRLLRPGGAFLNHGITWRAAETRLPGETFDARFVFPDGRLTTLYQVLQPAEECGFEVRDVENLREHYVLTLRHWVRRLEARYDEALRHVDDPTRRTWRLYLAGAAHSFAVGRTNVHQTLLVKPDDGRSGVPLTRADWYGAADDG